MSAAHVRHLPSGRSKASRGRRSNAPLPESQSGVRFLVILCVAQSSTVQDIRPFRVALDEYVAIAEHEPEPQLRIAVTAYVDQVKRLLDLVEYDVGNRRTEDAEIHFADAQRWLWKIA